MGTKDRENKKKARIGYPPVFETKTRKFGDAKIFHFTVLKTCFYGRAVCFSYITKTLLALVTHVKQVKYTNRDTG